ncbi:hypothetical protein BGZ80_008504, partial [Entomortierella chlamydospora]
MAACAFVERSIFSLPWQRSQTGRDLLKLSESKPDKNSKGFAETDLFIKGFKELLTWLKMCHEEKHDPAFTSWIIRILETTPGIMHYSFISSFSADVQVQVQDLYCLTNEHWLDDNIIWRIYQYFEISYQDQELQRPVMIPYDRMRVWRAHVDTPGDWDNEYRWDWMKGVITGDKRERVFTVVYMENHW